jgi:hypothetical protein
MIVSIVVEMGTREITGQISVDESMKHFIDVAKKSFSENEVEIIFSGCNVAVPMDLPKNCRRHLPR